MTDGRLESKYFLVMTKFQEFWRHAQKTVFLGEWCKPQDIKQAWEKLDYEVIDPPIVEKDVKGVYEDLDDIYKNLFPYLARWFNEIHKKNYSESYWEVLLGPWLYFHIQAVYDRYYRIKKAFGLYKDLSTVGLSEESFYTPINYDDHHLLVFESDEFNLQLCTQIVNCCFKKIPSVSFAQWKYEKTKLRRNYINLHKRRLISRILVRIFWLIARVKNGKLAAIHKVDSNSIKFSLRLMLKSRCKIIPIYYQYFHGMDDYIDASTNMPIDKQKRLKILNIPAKNTFYQAILNTLVYSTPLCFIENYESDDYISRKLYPFYTKVYMNFPVLSNVYIHLWRARYVEKGIINIATQHGGGYGILDLQGHEYIEKKFSNFFAQNVLSDDKKIISLPVLSSALTNIQVNNNKSIAILWVVTEPSKFAIEAWHTANQFKFETVYYEWQERFLDSLDDEIISKIIMRLRHTGNSDKWKTIENKFKLLHFHKPENRSTFISQLTESSLAIFDNLNTTFLTGMCLNIPSILFWSRDLFPIRQDAKEGFRCLEQARIYHSTPESAASMLKKIHNNPLEWWNQEQVQAARKQFCDKFMFSDYGFDKWINQLLPLI